MKPQSIDTDPRAEAVQIALLQKAGPVKRAALMRSLSHTLIRLSRRNLRELHPELSEQDLNVLFVRQCYGDEPADRLQVYLSRRNKHETA